MVQRPWFCKLIPFQIAKITNIFKGKLFCNVHFIVFEIIAKIDDTIVFRFLQETEGSKETVQPHLGRNFPLLLASS